MNRSTAIAFVLAVFLLHSAFAQSPLPSSASFDIGFSPGGSALAVVQKAIGAAESEILMACYELTSRDIAEALESAAHLRGQGQDRCRFQGLARSILTGGDTARRGHSGAPGPSLRDLSSQVSRNRQRDARNGKLQLHHGRHQAQRRERHSFVELTDNSNDLRRRMATIVGRVD